MRRENRNSAWADAFVDELLRGGLREACVASGSRSSPLVVALADRAAAGSVLLVPQVDERAAGFFALGAAKATGRPAAVVTTSGTAVANLMPAVVEAAQSEVPLLVLTADRPGHLRGTDSNQTIDQVGIFGRYTRLFHDVSLPVMREDLVRHLRALAGRALGAARGSPAGPVHLNFQFEKPLEPVPVPGDVPGGWEEEALLAAEGRGGEAPFTRVESGLPTLAPEGVESLAAQLAAARRGVIVCGPSPEPWAMGPAARELAGATGWPLLADALSGARFGPGATDHAVDAYDAILRSPEAVQALAPDVVLRLGSSPTSAPLRDYLSAHAGAEQMVVDCGARWKDPQALAGRYLRADPTTLCRALAARLRHEPSDGGRPPSGWAVRWREAAAAVRAAIEPELRERPFEGTVAADAARAAPSHAVFFVGSSMPVRDLDAFAPPREAPLLVLGNRGASGIDGGVSTALGAAAAHGAPALALLGDLAFYHDLTGLLVARKLDVDLTIVVVHNDGGGIFQLLPIREQPAFERFVAMPHGLDFSHAAGLYGLPFTRLDGAGEVRDALAQAGAGVRILEVRSDREENRRRHEEVAALARRAAARAVAVTATDRRAVRSR